MTISLPITNRSVFLARITPEHLLLIEKCQMHKRCVLLIDCKHTYHCFAQNFWTGQTTRLYSCVKLTMQLTTISPQLSVLQSISSLICHASYLNLYPVIQCSLCIQHFKYLLTFIIYWTGVGTWAKFLVSSQEKGLKLF